MNWSKLVISAACLTLALGCGKVRDDAGDTNDPGGNGGASSGGSGDGGGSSNGGGSANGGRNGTGAGGAGTGNAGSGGVSGSGGAATSGGTTSSGGASSSGGAATSGGTTSTGGVLGTGGAVVEEEGTTAMRAGPTVWIGQAETVVTYPGDLEEGRDPQKMILILDRVASGVTGTITFGSGAPPPVPTDPLAPYPPEQTWTAADGEYPVFNTNWMYSPYDGFSYSIVGSELRGNTLTLAFVPLELFDSWCEIQADNGEVCDCNDGGCAGKTGPTRRLELVVSGTSLSGQLSRPPGNWFGETPALKLERVK